MSGLADMITDALVITGRSSLSSYISEMNLISNSNIDLNRDTGVVKLEHSSVYEVPYINNNSYQSGYTMESFCLGTTYFTNTSDWSAKECTDY